MSSVPGRFDTCAERLRNDRYLVRSDPLPGDLGDPELTQGKLVGDPDDLLLL